MPVIRKQVLLIIHCQCIIDLITNYPTSIYRFGFIHFYFLLGTNGHQKEAILALLAADCNPEICRDCKVKALFSLKMRNC